MLFPSFSKFKNAEFIQYCDNSLTIFRAHDTAGLNIAPQVTTFEELFRTLEQLFLLDQGNVITEELEDLDDERDDCLIGININVDSYEKHFEEAKRQAGILLRNLLDKYGRDLYKRSYPEETAGIRSMVNELETNASLTTAASTLHLTDWFAKLKAVNDLFDEKYLKRNKAYADAPKAKFADVRKETEAAFGQVQKHLSAHAILNAGPGYDSLINELDQLTQTYDQAINIRKSRRSDDETPSPETD